MNPLQLIGTINEPRSQYCLGLNSLLEEEQIRRLESYRLEALERSRFSNVEEPKLKIVGKKYSSLKTYLKNNGA